MSASPEYVFSGNAHRAVTRNPEGRIFEDSAARAAPPIFPALRRLQEPESVPNPGARLLAWAAIA